ncbi:uncharacterized protein I206_105063 [Kwoniella pini CBS 10737]|uniref:Uncharacterized protein n=1 Tax=Kwoniella pini CBS 10737 TaxID=1296096 RepID=A0A1B9I8K6_9TREE|nr:uncharacterized protein I206_02603 [Kwoniella pini CBS 10737]OCF51887.1 hypothetical protein I206_02603 [Kwoniella pini CBS 10737]
MSVSTSSGHLSSRAQLDNAAQSASETHGTKRKRKVTEVGWDGSGGLRIANGIEYRKDLDKIHNITKRTFKEPSWISKDLIHFFTRTTPLHNPIPILDPCAESVLLLNILLANENTNPLRRKAFAKPQLMDGSGHESLKFRVFPLVMGPLHLVTRFTGLSVPHQLDSLFCDYLALIDRDRMPSGSYNMIGSNCLQFGIRSIRRNINLIVDVHKYEEIGRKLPAKRIIKLLSSIITKRIARQLEPLEKLCLQQSTDIYNFACAQIGHQDNDAETMKPPGFHGLGTTLEMGYFEDLIPKTPNLLLNHGRCLSIIIQISGQASYIRFPQLNLNAKLSKGNVLVAPLGTLLFHAVDHLESEQDDYVEDINRTDHSEGTKCIVIIIYTRRGLEIAARDDEMRRNGNGA